VVPLDDAAFVPRETQVKQGALLYARNCMVCHGLAAVASGFAPDLRASPIALSAAAFTDIVSRGSLVKRGMPQFPELAGSQLDALRSYVRSQARDSLAQLPDRSSK
jgi:quinohemoprotein ethanol dehydrogenase